MTTQRTVTLNNGVEMPIIGFGVYQIPPEETEAAVTQALEAGYRHLDTAAAYGNEEGVGRAVAASGIARDELFVTTKLWIHSHGKDATKRAFDDSLAKLGLDHIDLYLIHQPIGDVYGEWRDMEEINADGRARAIGVSNFLPDRLADLIAHNEVVPAVNQIETHPFHQRATDHRIMLDLGVQHESWGPFAEGKNGLFTNPVLSGIAEAHGKTVGQVVLHWLTQRDIVVIPKSVRRERMDENLGIFDFELTADEVAQIETLEEGGSQFFDHSDVEMVQWLSSRKAD